MDQQNRSPATGAHGALPPPPPQPTNVITAGQLDAMVAASVARALASVPQVHQPAQQASQQPPESFMNSLLDGIGLAAAQHQEPPALQQGPPARPEDFPVTLGSAVGSAPGFVVALARGGGYVDLRLVAPENLSKLPSRAPAPAAFDTLVASLAPVDTIAKWLEAFMAYVSLVARDLPFKIPDLAEYALLISFAARNFRGDGWKTYDSRYRQDATISSVWANINQNLWQVTVVSCHIAAASQTARAPAVARASTSSAATDNRAEQVCFAFNKGTCSSRPCPRQHVCLICRSTGHKDMECPTRAPALQRSEKRRRSRSPRGDGKRRKNGSGHGEFFQSTGAGLPSLRACTPYNVDDFANSSRAGLPTSRACPPDNGEYLTDMSGAGLPTSRACSPYKCEYGLVQSGAVLPPPEACTPFIIDKWVELSANLPDTDLRNYVLVGLQEGFRLCFNDTPLASATRNSQSAYKHPDVVDEYLSEELQRGSIVGPFACPPMENLHISKFGVIPKSAPGEWRLILDLSSPSGFSVNDGISPEDSSVHYQTVDQAIDAITLVGRGALLSKFDVERAYRNIPVHPDDRRLLGMKWRGSFWVDLVLPFGSRPSASIFSSVADVLQFILSTVVGRSIILHYLDDFLNVFNPSNLRRSEAPRLAGAELSTELATCDELGVPIKASKLVMPTTCLSFLGIVLDSEALEARLPEDKIIELRDLVTEWRGKRSGSKRQVESLTGKLMFAAQIIPAGRPFLRALINSHKSAREAHHWVHLNAACREDLVWWLELLSEWNGISMFRFRGWSEIADFQMASDAAVTKGLGISFGKEWIAEEWPAGTPESVKIFVLELIPIVVAAHIWGHNWVRCRILFYSDNSAAVDAIESGLPRHPHLASLVRELARLSILMNFSVKAVHVPGKLNTIADALSRFDFQEFRRLRPDANRSPTRPPVGLLERLVLPPSSTSSG